MPAVHAAEEEQRKRRDRDDHEGAEIRLAQQQPRDEQHHRKHRQQAASEALQHAVLAHRVVRGVEHRGELHQLGGLHAHHRQCQPAARPVHFPSDPGNQNHREQRHAGEEQPRRGALPPARRHEKHDQRGAEGGSEKHRVAGEKPCRAVAGVAVRFRSGDRRRVHHHQPRRGEQQCGPGERAIVLCRRRVARKDEGLAHSSARTAVAKISPRCL